MLLIIALTRCPLKLCDAFTASCAVVFLCFVSLFVHFWPICPLLVSLTHTHTCIHDYKVRKKRPYCVQQSICLLQLSNFEDDVRMWQSPLYPPACFITGVIHTKRKCVYVLISVCVCVHLPFQPGCVLDCRPQTTLRSEDCYLIGAIITLAGRQTQRNTHVHFTPLLWTTPTGRVCIWRGCVSVFWRNGGWM